MTNQSKGKKGKDEMYGRQKEREKWKKEREKNWKKSSKEGKKV